MINYESIIKKALTCEALLDTIKDDLLLLAMQDESDFIHQRRTEITVFVEELETLKND